MSPPTRRSQLRVWPWSGKIDSVGCKMNEKTFFWNSVPEVIEWLHERTGTHYAEKAVLSLALRKVFRVCARIPNWERPGAGELRWIKTDSGTDKCLDVSKNIITEGISTPLPLRHLERLWANGKVQLSGLEWVIDENVTLVSVPDAPFITLEDLRIPRPDLKLILEALQASPEQGDKSSDKKPSRRARQIDAILKEISNRKLNPLAIPRGGKRTIEDACLMDANLFSENSFKRAWQAAIDDGRVRTKDHDIHSGG